MLVSSKSSNREFSFFRFVSFSNFDSNFHGKKEIECLSLSVHHSLNVKLRFFYCYSYGTIHAKGEISLLYMYMREIGNTQIRYYRASKIEINGTLFNAILVHPLTL